MVAIMCNGMAGNVEIKEEDDNYLMFAKALNKVSVSLCRMIAADGEGASKLLICKVFGAKTDFDAKKIAKCVICSALVKTAIFGADANWGRILCAIGYSGVNVDISKIGVSFGSCGGEVKVCQNGVGIIFSEEMAKKYYLRKRLRF